MTMDAKQRAKVAALKRERDSIVIGMCAREDISQKKYKRATAAVNRKRDSIKKSIAEGGRWSEKRIRTELIKARDTEIK